jgi:hypothetical protein
MKEGGAVLRLIVLTTGNVEVDRKMMSIKNLCIYSHDLELPVVT